MPGAVVTKAVAAHTKVGGIPAKLVEILSSAST